MRRLVLENSNASKISTIENIFIDISIETLILDQVFNTKPTPENLIYIRF